ncbi:hypothetical protein LguiB_018770 [Lonicera macranthoides]
MAASANRTLLLLLLSLLLLITFSTAFEGFNRLQPAGSKPMDVNLYGEEALKLFMEMQNDNLSPTEHTLTSILDACGSLTTLQQRRQVPVLIIKVSLDRNVFVIMITGYAQSGRGLDELQLFERLMHEKEFVPDYICFATVLATCNHDKFLGKGILQQNKKGL